MERRRARMTQGDRINGGKDQFDHGTVKFDHGACKFDINGTPGEFDR